MNTKQIMILLFLLMIPKAGWACECMHEPPSFDEAAEDSTLIFTGIVEKITWRGLPGQSEPKDIGNGMQLTIMDYIDPGTPEMPYNPKNSKLQAGYKVYFNVVRLWKDTEHAVKEHLVAIETVASGGCWFEGDGQYLVYAKKRDPFPPFVKLCGRSKPLNDARDDIILLNARKGERHGHR